MINDNFQKLKRLISEDKILLLPHKKYKGNRQMLVYARCGISKKYFEKAYNNGDVILQIGELGPRIEYPIPWEVVFEEELNGKEGENNQNKDETIQNFENTIKEHEDQLSKRMPISPMEVIKRTSEIQKILEWCMKKHLTISGPEFFGTHHIFITDKLKHAVICLKSDFTTHLFIGDPVKAEEWRKYDKNIKILFSKQLKKDSLEWKIYDDYVLYRGNMLEPKDIKEEPYWGEVVQVEEFNQDITDEWLVHKIRELYNKW